MTNLLSLKFWFNIRPGALSDVGVYVFISLIVGSIVLSFVLKFLTIKSKEKLYRRFLRKIQSLVVSNTIVILIMFFLMYETSPFLSGRFWILIWGLINIVWFYFIYKFYSRIPGQKAERIKEEEYNKYLP
jgi:amino acid transporter